MFLNSSLLLVCNKIMSLIIKKIFTINTSLISYLSNATTTITLTHQIAHKFGWDINIGLIRVQIQYTGVTEDF